MSEKIKGNQKHLTLSQRLIIEKELNDQTPFAQIARRLQKDPSYILVSNHNKSTPIWSA